VSKYFQVLERLDGAGPRKGTRPARPAGKPVVDARSEPKVTESDVGTEAPPLHGPGTTAIAEIRARPAPRIDLPPPLLFPPTASSLKGVDAVFNNLEALTRGQRPVALVFAGASASDSVRGLATSLGEYAEAKGEQVLVAELCDSGGERMLVCRHPPEPVSAVEGAGRPSLPVDLHGGATRETLARWREQVAPGTDVMLLLGPPLLESVDSPLLASLCDGLVMVVVHEETHRASLAIASERARLTKSPTFGVVVNNGRDKTPAWLRRIME
jgi:hypothetical protein